MHHTLTQRLPLTALALAAMAALAGCGGGSTDGSVDGSEESMKIGDQYAVQIYDANDALLSEATRKIFGVTASGQLIDNPADPALMPGATATLPVTSGQAELDRLELDAEAFLASFLIHAAQRSGYNKSAHAAWEDMLDHDAPLDQVMADFRQSGLDMAGFIDFYAAIDEAKVVSFGDRAELDLRDWLQTAQANQSDLLAVLDSFGMKWPGFLALVAARGDSLQGLHIRQQNLQEEHDDFPKAASACKESTLGYGMLCKLMNVYLNEPTQKSVQTKVADPASAAMTAAVEAAKLKLEIAKFTWQVIKENRPSIEVDTGAARTSILSASDSDPLSYEYAKPASSETRKIVVCTKVVKCIKDWAKVELRVSGTHQARHANHKGQWIPSVQLETPYIWAFAGQKVNLSAYVTNPSNLGARDDALPYAEIVADMNVAGNITADRIQTKFTVHGKDGFKLVR